MSPTVSVSSVFSKLCYKPLGLLELLRPQHWPEGIQVASAGVSQFGDWKAWQAWLEVQCGDLAVLDVALIMVRLTPRGRGAE